MENKTGTKFYLEADLITDPATNTYPAYPGANYLIIACAVSNGFSIAVADQDTSNKCDEGWGTSVAGQATFNFTIDGQIVSLTDTEEETKMNAQALLQAAIDKQVFFVRMTGLPDEVEFYREGKVRITSYEETAPNADAYTFTASFTGIGKPRIVAPTS